MDKVTPKCPYCGMPMILCVDAYSDGTIAGAYYECVSCKSDSPYIEDTDDIKAAALTAATQRYVEPNRVLTLVEIEEAFERFEPVYLEFKGLSGGLWVGNGNSIYGALDDANMAKYIEVGCYPIGGWDDEYAKLWRCWLRYSTDAEREAVPWGGRHRRRARRSGEKKIPQHGQSCDSA